MSFSKSVSLISLVLLFGAGCAATDFKISDTGSSNSAPAITPSAETAMPAVNTSSTTPVMSTSSTVMVDDSWHTYTNAALKFSFQWPTKTIYAPHWKVTFEKVEPCGTLGVIQDVRGVSFCHKHVQEGNIITDYYATKNGELYVLITFTNSSTGIPSFKLDEYQAMLSTIISTFKYAQ